MKKEENRYPDYDEKNPVPPLSRPATLEEVNTRAKRVMVQRIRESETLIRLTGSVW